MDYEALEQLVRLRDSGAITDEEFADQKVLLTGAVRMEGADVVRGQRPRGTKMFAVGVGVIGIAVIALVYLSGSTISGLVESVPPEEQQCRSAIKASLINPETVEFFEFAPVGREAYLSEFRDNLRSALDESVSDSGSGLYGVYARGMAAAREGIISKHANESTHEERNRLAAEKLNTYSYRIKADGKLGNTITETQYCSANSRSCLCV